MHNGKVVGAGVAAAAIAAGLAYVLLANNEEEAAFDLVADEGPFSVRDYPGLLVAETVNPGRRERALTLGFTALADYQLSGCRRRMPMLVPILADGVSGDDAWRLRFVLPAAITPDALAVPGEGIELRALPPRRVAALRFDGDKDDAALRAHEERLRAWIAARQLCADGAAEHAFYDWPFIPGPMRRGEVLIPLAV